MGVTRGGVDLIVRNVVDGILSVVGVVVDTKQTVNLSVDEEVDRQSLEATPGWHRGWPGAGWTADVADASVVGVGDEAGVAEGVAAVEDTGFRPEARLEAETTRQELLGQLFRLVASTLEWLVDVGHGLSPPTTHSTSRMSVHWFGPFF